MNDCLHCGGTLVVTTLPLYHDDSLLGLPNVLLYDAALEYKCPGCGKVGGTSVPDIEGLEAAVAVARVMYPAKLNGCEIRFLRKALGKKSKDLAEQLGVEPETYCRYESGGDPISPQSEKALRLIAGCALTDLAPAVPFSSEKISEMKIKHLRDAGTHLTFECRRVKNVEKERNDRASHQRWQPEPRKAA